MVGIRFVNACALSEPGFLGFEDSHDYFFVSGIIIKAISVNPKNRDLDI